MPDSMGPHSPGYEEEALAAMLQVAREAALEAGKLARQMLTEPRHVRSKGRRDIVTDADVAAQAVITGHIRAAFPDHGFMPEEADSDLPEEGPVLWLIDPIDGTTNYSRGLPIFAVSVAAVHNPLGRLPAQADALAGVIYDPMQDELFTAVAGGPALLNGEVLRAGDIDDLSEAIIGVDWSHEQELRQAGLESVAALVHDVDVLRTIGSAALGLAWVAAGRLDAYINYRLKPWDVAAAGLLIRRAGGVITALQGKPLILDPHGLDCLAGNASLVQILTGRLERPYA